MSNQTPPLPSVQRLFAEGRILAAFLTEEIACGLPEFIRAPESDRASVREKFGLAATANLDSAPHPGFRHVVELDAIALLQGVSPLCSSPPNLSNFVGFEWVEIDGIFAGHYVAAPMPVAGRFPNIASPISEIARYSIFGSQIGSDLVAQGGIVVSPEKLRLRFNGLNLGPQGLTVNYAVSQEPSPVALLLVEDRVFAVRHQERLVALLEAGIREALCLVYYGYGIDALRFLPTISPTFLNSSRPPRIVDFTNDKIMNRIHVPPPRTIVTFLQHTVDLAG